MRGLPTSDKGWETWDEGGEKEGNRGYNSVDLTSDMGRRDKEKEEECKLCNTGSSLIFVKRRLNV